MSYYYVELLAINQNGSIFKKKISPRFCVVLDFIVNYEVSDKIQKKYSHSSAAVLQIQKYVKNKLIRK